MKARTMLGLGATALVACLLAAPAWASEGGLNIFPDISPTGRLVQLMVLFVILIFPVDRLIFRPLLGVLDERTARIDGARARAAEVAGHADEVLGRYQQAIDAARREAEGERMRGLEAARREQAQVTAEARGGAEREVAEARGRVQAQVEEARKALRQDADSLAREVASQVLGRSIS